MKRIFIAGFALLAVTLVSAVVFYANNMLIKTAAVTGKVVNTKGESLRGIKVQACRTGMGCEKTFTESDGSYLIKIEGPQPFNLTFEGGGFQPALVLHLSGEDNHQIVMVLLKDGEGDTISKIAGEIAKRYLQQVSYNGPIKLDN